MGAVSKVRLRPDKIGGSAFSPKPRHSFMNFFKRGSPNLFKRQHHHKETSPGGGGGGGAKDGSVNHVNEQVADGTLYALKTILLDRVSTSFYQELQNEIAILRTLDHPNIVRLYEVYVNKHNTIYMVLELCDGGDLHKRQPYSEKEAAKYTHQLLSAILYMHERGVVHRDLKYENILFESCSPDADIKVIDFGLSKKFLGETLQDMYDRVGTIYTMAPQVLQGVYSSQADLWSIGVICYMLLSSSKPFWHQRRRNMVDLIMRADYNFKSPAWKHVSEEAKDFVSKLLVLDPLKRMNAKSALQHTWIIHRKQWDDQKPPKDELLSVLDESLLFYTQTSELKKLALNVIAHRSTTKDILELRRAFEKCDTNTNGIITFVEFREALKDCKYPEETLRQIFSSIDINKNGRIDYTEFLAATIEARGQITEDRIAQAFDRLDSDDTGFISKKNLEDILGDDAELIDKIIKSCDKDKDGKISYKEFLSAFREQTFVAAKRLSSVEQSEHDTNSDLVGLDARIPGGRFDSNVDDSFSSQGSLYQTTRLV